MKTIQTRLDAIGRRIEALVARLQYAGYLFDRPEDVFPGPDPSALRVVAEIESTVGRVPLALKLFWLRIGSIDLSGSHPDWYAAGYLDPLIVFPPAIAHYELNDYVLDRTERDRLGIGYEVPIAPDYFHKANVSGGPPYSIPIPASEDDPLLRHTPKPETFLEHIERGLRFGGFPGLELSPGHTWPVASLVDEA